MQIRSNIIEFDIWELFVDEDSKLYLVYDEANIAAALNQAADYLHVLDLDGFAIVCGRDNGTCRFSVSWEGGYIERHSWISSHKRLTIKQTKAEAPEKIRQMLDLLNEQDLTLVNEINDA